MKTPQALQDLLAKPMDRQEFLKHLGIGVVMLLGGGAILQIFGGETRKPTGSGSQYGGFTYGGNTESLSAILKT